jgi:hypothetical protein
VTTNHQLQWLLLYVMLDYRVQRKMHAEFDAAALAKGHHSAADEFQPEAIFTLGDKLRLPYTNAVINVREKHKKEKYYKKIKVIFKKMIKNKHIKLNGIYRK